MQTCALASAHASRPLLGSPTRSGHPWFAAAQRVGVWACAALLALASCMAQAQPLRGWDEWKAAYVAADGRVTDTGQRNISHSEGQGFGMVLATAANDKATFERIWHWTQTNLGTRPDGLFAWRWEPGRGVTDTNTAADGDLFIAWGLQRAAERFGTAAYKDKAAATAKAIRDKMVQDGTPWGTILKPAVDGFTTPQGQVVNMSYWVFPAFDALNKVDPHPQWEALTKSGLRLTEIARFGRWGLPPDWLLLVNPLQPDPSRATRYGYDAARIPLYLHWAGKADAGKIDSFTKFWTHFKCDAFLPGWANVVDNSIDSYGADPGVAAIRTLLMSGKPPATRLPMSAQSYYSATLGMLVEVATREGGRR